MFFYNIVTASPDCLTRCSNFRHCSYSRCAFSWARFWLLSLPSSKGISLSLSLYVGRGGARKPRLLIPIWAPEICGKSPESDFWVLVRPALLYCRAPRWCNESSRRTCETPERRIKSWLLCVESLSDYVSIAFKDGLYEAALVKAFEVSRRISDIC